jgi:Zn finger protein HypA/HybF involved in hydrogenase expression
MDIGSITAAVGSLRAAGEIAVGLINLKTMAEVQTKAIELNGKILAAQHELFAANAAQAAFIERIRELEKQITDMKAWETEKQRYKLASPVGGSIVYALQKSMSDGEPAHYICANCYQDGKKSILQNSFGHSWTTFVCPVCKSEATTGYSGHVRPNYAEELKRS